MPIPITITAIGSVMKSLTGVTVPMNRMKMPTRIIEIATV